MANPHVVAPLDDVLTSTYIWKEDLAALNLVSAKLLAATRLVKFTKCICASSRQGVLDMVIDSTGVRPSASKMAVSAKIPRSTNVEGLRPIVGMTGNLRQYVERYSAVATTLTNLVRNKACASERARKSLVVWGKVGKKTFPSPRGRSVLSSDFRVPVVESPIQLAHRFHLCPSTSILNAGNPW